MSGNSNDYLEKLVLPDACRERCRGNLSKYLNPVYLAGYIEQVGTGTNDVIDRCVELGLRRPEFRQDEVFMVVMWRKEVAGTVQSDPERSKSDPNLIQNDPNLVEQVYQLIVKDQDSDAYRKVPAAVA